MNLSIETLLELGVKTNVIELAPPIEPTEGDEYMGKRQLIIQLETIKDVKDFVTIASGYATDMYVQCGNFTVDAKSLMGLLSLDLERPFILSIDSVDFASIEKDFKKWAICND